MAMEINKATVQSPLIILTCFAIQIITKLERQEREPWPVGRSYHAACCLGFDSQHPHLLVSGGVDNDDKTLRDAWLFDVMNRKWKEVSLSNNQLSIMWFTGQGQVSSNS